MAAQEIGSKAVAEVIVRKTVVVNVPQAHAFAVFTEKHGTWWPLNTHHIGAKPAQTAVIESHAGGRWFERAADGTECDWGRVLVWQPPNRLVLSWEVGSDWKRDAKLSTPVEVRFIVEGPQRTRVELEHRNLERFGESAEAMRSTFDSAGGWTGILERFASVAAGSAAGAEAPCPAN